MAKRKTSKEYKYSLREDIQTAVEIELATIPIYLYTYYSINKSPKGDTPEESARLRLEALKASGTIMSVAIEEMLHMALSSNLKSSLGWMPHLAGKSPKKFPTPLPKHAPGFAAPLSRYTQKQLEVFKGIEKPATREEIEHPTDDGWHSLSEFYQTIIDRIKDKKASDFNTNKSLHQLRPTNKYPESKHAVPSEYYAPNSVNSTYTDKKGKQVRMNAGDSGGLIYINSAASAKRAINEISHQGEGFVMKGQTTYDDRSKEEWTHYHKFLELSENFNEEDAAKYVLDVPDNPVTKNYPPTLQPLSNLTNAVYTYMFMMMEQCYTNPIPAQASIFNFGIHKGMIFILSSLCSFMTGFQIKEGNKHYAGKVVAPTFENYKFDKHVSPKEQLIMIWKTIPKNFKPDRAILDRIKNLPDVEMKAGELVQF